MEKPVVKPGDKCRRCDSTDTILFRRSSLRFNKRLKCNQCGAVYEPPLRLISRVGWVLGGLILCGFGVFMILGPSVEPERVSEIFQRILGLFFWTSGIIVAYRGSILKGSEIFSGSPRVRNIYEHI